MLRRFRERAASPVSATVRHTLTTLDRASAIQTLTVDPLATKPAPHIHLALAAPADAWVMRGVIHLTVEVGTASGLRDASIFPDAEGLPLGRNPLFSAIA